MPRKKISRPEHNQPHPNQYKPLPPLNLIKPYMLRYYKYRWPVTRIHQTIVEKHLDTDIYGIGLTNFKAYMKNANLLGTRHQAYTVDGIRPAMVELRATYPMAGVKEMRNLLFHERDMKVSKSVIEKYFIRFEHDLIRQRKAKRLKRKRFWAAGVNDLLVFDQHDKWKVKFGLALHIGLDPFAGYIKWLRVWWSNNNPVLICSYFLDSIEELGHMSLITQSDLGSENYGIANAQTMLRQLHDPSLIGTLQHRWKRLAKNVMPEIAWSQFRCRFAPGFEDILDLGVTEGWFEPSDLRQSLVFRWIFIPWIQAELDAYRERLNLTSKRADHNKVLPHGPPDHIYQDAPAYGCLDFKVTVVPEHVGTVRERYAKTTHRVFKLVPDSFGRLCQTFYEATGSPSITRSNVWEVYLSILQQFDQLDDAQYAADLPSWQENFDLAAKDTWDGDDAIPPPEGTELLDADYDYYGGVNGGRGLDVHLQQEIDRMEGEAPNGFEDIADGPIVYADFGDDDFYPEDENDTESWF